MVPQLELFGSLVHAAADAAQAQLGGQGGPHRRVVYSQSGLLTSAAAILMVLLYRPQHTGSCRRRYQPQRPAPVCKASVVELHGRWLRLPTGSRTIFQDDSKSPHRSSPSSRSEINIV